MAIDGATGKLFSPEIKYKLRDCTESKRQLQIVMERNAELAQARDREVLDLASLRQKLKTADESAQILTKKAQRAYLAEQKLQAVEAEKAALIRRVEEQERLLATMKHTPITIPTTQKVQRRALLLQQRRTTITITLDQKTYEVDTAELMAKFAIDMTRQGTKKRCGIDACTLIDPGAGKAVKTGFVSETEVERQRLAAMANISPRVYTGITLYDIVGGKQLMGFAMEAFTDSLAGLLGQQRSPDDAAAIVQGLSTLITSTAVFSLSHEDLHADNIVYRVEMGRYVFRIIDWSVIAVADQADGFLSAMQWLVYTRALSTRERSLAITRSIAHTVMTYLEYYKLSASAATWYSMMQTLANRYRDFYVPDVAIRVEDKQPYFVKTPRTSELRCGSLKY